MLILAIDTTGLFSSLALVEDGNRVIYNKRKSVSVTGKNWRDFPYILPERHRDFILKEVNVCFRECKKDWDDIDAIAVSAGSGIYSCIVTGLSIAETWARTYEKKLIKVDHILAHVYSTWLERDPKDFEYPILVFSASGSHSDFSLIKNPKEMQTILNETPEETDKDLNYFIGVGKYFYRMANILLPEKEKGDWKNIFKYSSNGNPHKYDLQKYYYQCEEIICHKIKKIIKQDEVTAINCINLDIERVKEKLKVSRAEFQQNKPLQYKFFGDKIEKFRADLNKTYKEYNKKKVNKILETHNEEFDNIMMRKKVSQKHLEKLLNHKVKASLGRVVANDLLFDFDFSDLLKGLDILATEKKDKQGKLSGKIIPDFAASFEHSLSEIVVDKIKTLVKMLKIKEIHIVGGISANEYFEKLIREKTTIKIRFPKKFHYKLDNAAMIGALAYYQKKYKIKFKGFKPTITK